MNKYITKKAITEPWGLNSNPPKSFYRFIIVIPSFKEGYEIIPTLESITLQDMELQKKLLVVFVINNSDDADDQTIKQNKFTSRVLLQFECNFDICTIDAYQEYPLPKKQAGVGLARKIGFDLVLPYSSKNTILCGLDADTIISKHYLNTIDTYFINQKIDCLIPGIKHQNGATLDVEKAIRDYEDFLFSTAENLQKAGSPFGFITMGSAMAFTSNCYMKAGGISRKKATEDFYFLQEVVKTTSVITIPEILVHPSSRVSDRVYLGTGFRMWQAQTGYELTDFQNIEGMTRYYRWQLFFKYYPENFIFGLGPGGWGKYVMFGEYRYPHNIIIEFFLMYGLLGLTSFFLISLTCFNSIIKILRNNEISLNIKSIGLAWVFYFIAAMFSGSFIYGNLSFFIFSGLLVGINLYVDNYKKG